MAENSKIEWTHHTWNPWRGCVKVSPACDHCYAETMAKRNPKTLGEWGPDSLRVVASESYWQLPLKWDREAAAAGERRRVFALSLGDFAEERPDLVGPRMRMFQTIGQCLNLDFLLLTKRPEVCREHWPLWAGWWAGARLRLGDTAAAARVSENGFVLPNVWLGTTIENQVWADKRIPHLLRTPAAVRFLSIEPMLGPVGLTPFLWGKNDAVDAICQNCPRDADCECGYHTRLVLKLPALDWVIVGGESGHGARPMHPEWARSIRDHCQAAGVPFFFKQWGEWAPTFRFPEQFDGVFLKTPTTFLAADGHRGQSLAEMAGHPKPGLCVRVGKKLAGRRLDGLEWNEYPSPKSVDASRTAGSNGS